MQQGNCTQTRGYMTPSLYLSEPEPETLGFTSGRLDLNPTEVYVTRHLRNVFGAPIEIETLGAVKIGSG